MDHDSHRVRSAPEPVILYNTVKLCSTQGPAPWSGGAQSSTRQSKGNPMEATGQLRASGREPDSSQRGSKSKSHVHVCADVVSRFGKTNMLAWLLEHAAAMGMI